MKKTITLLTALALASAFLFIGCGGDNDNDNTLDPTNDTAEALIGVWDLYTVGFGVDWEGFLRFNQDGTMSHIGYEYTDAEWSYADGIVTISIFGNEIDTWSVWLDDGILSVESLLTPGVIATYRRAE